MTSIEQIEEAIRALPPVEREKLIHDLPSLLPELNDHAAWERILRDPMTRPGLTTCLNELDSSYTARPESFPELKEGNFDANP